MTAAPTDCWLAGDSDGAQLLAARTSTAAVVGLVFATISPSFGLPLGLGLYVDVDHGSSRSPVSPSSTDLRDIAG